jgi:hypothetical protein
MKRATILLVEDNRIARKMVRVVLETEGPLPPPSGSVPT